MANRQTKEKIRKGNLKGRFRTRSGSETQTYDDGSFKKWGTQVVNTGPTASSAFSGVAYRQHVNPFEQYWDLIFKDEVTKSEPTERENVIATLQGMLRDQDIRLKYALVNRPSLRVDLFFNSQATRYFILETDVLHGRVRQSLVMNNKHIAINAYKNKSIRWRKEVSM